MRTLSILLVAVGCGSSTEPPAQVSATPLVSESTAEPIAEPIPERVPQPSEAEPRETGPIRLLFGGQEGRRLAHFVQDDGPNFGCTDDVCGQLVAPGGTAQSATVAADDAREMRPTTVLLSQERNRGRPMFRVRVQGAEAVALAELIGPYALAHAPGGVPMGDHHSCVLDDAAKPTCGFILDSNGVTYHLEFFGYD